MINNALFSTGTNDWATPQDLFDDLNSEFQFTLDPCASHENAKCEKYYTIEDNGLIQDWGEEVVFCNPPYSNTDQTAWVQKCYEHGEKGQTAVMLIPSRTDTHRFHDYILNKAEVRFIRGRLKFGEGLNSAPFPSIIVIFGPMANMKGSVIINNKYRDPASYLEGTKQTLVLVDYSNLMYRAWFVANRRPWVAYCKFFDMLRLCVKRSKQRDVPLKVIFAGESKTKLRRKKLDPTYKDNRPKIKDPKFDDFRKGLNELIEFLGWEVLIVDEAEADDVIASIVATHCHRCMCKVPCDNCDCASKYDTDVVIFSGDGDLQQCLEWDRTFVYRAPGLFVTKDSFETEYGFPVNKFKIYKALVGDNSDNIKGVEGFGPAKAKIAIKANSVAEDVWEMHGPDGADQFKHALELVKLDHSLNIDIESVYNGIPLIGEDKDFNKKFNEKVLLEVKRLKEEF